MRVEMHERELPPEPRHYLQSFYERADSRAAMKTEALAYIAHHPLITLYRTFNRTLDILKEWREILERTARRLLEKETLEEAELMALVQPALPPRAAAE